LKKKCLKIWPKAAILIFDGDTRISSKLTNNESEWYSEATNVDPRISWIEKILTYIFVQNFSRYTRVYTVLKIQDRFFLSGKISCSLNHKEPIFVTHCAKVGQIYIWKVGIYISFALHASYFLVGNSCTANIYLGFLSSV
jgi:hypothetical protein